MEHAQRNLRLNSNPVQNLTILIMRISSKSIKTHTILITLLFSRINPKINHAFLLGFL